MIREPPVWGAPSITGAHVHHEPLISPTFYFTPMAVPRAPSPAGSTPSLSCFWFLGARLRCPTLLPLLRADLPPGAPVRCLSCPQPPLSRRAGQTAGRGGVWLVPTLSWAGLGCLLHVLFQALVHAGKFPCPKFSSQLREERPKS